MNTAMKPPPLNLFVYSANKGFYKRLSVYPYLNLLSGKIRISCGINPIYCDKLTSSKEPPSLLTDAFVIPQDRLAERLFKGFVRGIMRSPSDYHFYRSWTKAIQKTGANAVLAEGTRAGILIMDVCRKLRIPLFVIFHANEVYETFYVKDLPSSYANLFGAANAIIGVSKPVYKRLLEMGSPQNKTHCIPYGVDTQIFRGADPQSAPPVFLCTESLKRLGGSFLLLLAYQRVREACPESRLRIAGEGPLFESSRQLARILDIWENADFLGNISDLELAIEMRSARALLVHTTQGSEGEMADLPHSVLAAGAAGLPVIAAKQPAVESVIEHGFNGLLFDGGDITAMSQRMIQLAREPHTAAVLGSNASKRVSEEFAIEKTTKRLSDLIASNIADKAIA